MTGTLDWRTPVLRDPDEIARKLSGWFRARLTDRADVRLTEFGRPSGSGGSGENFLITVESTPPGGVVTEDQLVVRTAPGDFGAVYESDLATYFRVLTELRQTAVPVPDPLWLELDPGVIGISFMVMTRVPGQVPTDYPTYNEAGFLKEATPAERRVTWTAALGCLAEVGRVDPARFAFLDRPDRGPTPLRQKLQYQREAAEWACGGPAPRRLTDAIDFLAGCVPDDSPAGLTWGDARPGNMLFDGGRCTAALDWEGASFSGPLVDLGWWLLFDAMHAEDYGAVRLEGLASRDETIRFWEEHTGLTAAGVRWYEILAGICLAIRRERSLSLRRSMGLPVTSDDDPAALSDYWTGCTR